MTDTMTEGTGGPARQGKALTRAGVADRLGVSLSTVRRLEGHALHPVRDAKGVHVFDRAEVERLAPTRVRRRPLNEGRLAAELFRLFEAGRDLRQIVAELEVPPGKVRTLYAEWSAPDLKAGERRRREEKAEKNERREAHAQERHMLELERLNVEMAQTLK